MNVPKQSDRGDHAFNHWPSFWLCTAAFVIVSAGCYLRFHIWHEPGHAPGFDERVYVSYVEQLDVEGLAGFPGIVRNYVNELQNAKFVYLPPFRVGYVIPAYLLHKVTTVSPYEALRNASALASCLFLLPSFAFAWRWGGRKRALAILALLACAPLQIHIAQYAFIDGVAAFWAIMSAGFFWQSLQQPKRYSWLAGFGLSLFALYLTKQELAVFVSSFIGIALITSRSFGFGQPRWIHSIALGVSAMLALLVLVLISGDVSTLVRAFCLYFQRSKTLPYALMTGDGPWYRYLVEHVLVNPIVVFLV